MLAAWLDDDDNHQRYLETKMICYHYDALIKSKHIEVFAQMPIFLKY